MQGEEQDLRVPSVSQKILFYFYYFFDFSLRGKQSCMECTGLKRKCGMMEKESQKSRRMTTKRKRADDDDDDKERPR